MGEEQASPVVISRDARDFADRVQHGGDRERAASRDHFAEVGVVVDRKFDDVVGDFGESRLRRR